MDLNDIHMGSTPRPSRKRVGRGVGSGHGKTSGRGHKGAGSRNGHSHRLVFEGGQKTLMRRVAKRGFNNRQFALVVAEVNVGALESVFEAGAEVTPELMVEKGLAKGRFDVVKILGDGELTKKLTVRAHRFSAGAQERIAAAGGVAQRIVP